MSHRKLVLILIMAVLTLGAGVVVGWVWTPLAKVAAIQSDAHTPRPWFDQLGLTTDQQKDMDKIWGDTRAQRQKLLERGHELDKQRDQQILSLLDTNQRAAYDKINADFHSKREELDKERESMIADANVRSRALLDDSQKKKWDVLSKEMRGRRGPMGLSTQRSTTMPSHEGEGHYH